MKGGWGGVADDGAKPSQSGNKMALPSLAAPPKKQEKLKCELLVPASTANCYVSKSSHYYRINSFVWISWQKPGREFMLLALFSLVVWAESPKWHAF
jgi:hypothetical protein